MTKAVRMLALLHNLARDVPAAARDRDLDAHDRIRALLRLGMLLLVFGHQAFFKSAVVLLEDDGVAVGTEIGLFLQVIRQRTLLDQMQRGDVRDDIYFPILARLEIEVLRFGVM